MIFLNGDCSYHDVISSPSLNNSMIHLNIRSLITKVYDLDRFLRILDFLKIVIISEMRINDNSSLININSYTFVSLPRSTGIGSVDFYVHNSINFQLKIDPVTNQIILILTLS